MLVLVRFNSEDVGTIIVCDDWDDAFKHAEKTLVDAGGEWTEHHADALYDAGILLPCGDRLQICRTEMASALGN